MKPQTHSGFISREQTVLLKGFAILGVLILHLFSAFPFDISSLHPASISIIVLDQLSRFCVPLFVATTGYGFMQKYKDKKLEPIPFYILRLKKLLPLFFLWSAVSLFLLQLDPIWNKPISVFPLWIRFFIGQADYHLYYVPMLCTLIFLFPILKNAIEKHAYLTIGTSLVLQSSLYVFYDHFAEVFSRSSIVINDQAQYLFALSWILYFTLGMFLGYKRHKVSPFFALFLVGIGLFWTFRTVFVGYSQTKDLVSLFRFTKLPILVYSSGFVLFFLQFSAFFPHWMKKIFMFLGSQSFVIYLSHPLIFRIVNGSVYHTIPQHILFGSSVVIILTLLISKPLVRL